MSKKKAFSGSTMTLKDFHGGSIPSDLPLPSAPGVSVRPADRGGFDRQGAWGNPMGRSDQRLRPGSSPAARHLDDKTPFLANMVRIGRNFDEDERKPLDGISAPRKTVSDESIYGSRSDLKPDSYSARVAETTNMGVSSGRPGSGSGSPLPSSSVGRYSGRVSEAAHVTSQNVSGANSQVVGGSQTNVWAARKEVVANTEASPFAQSGLDAVSKLAHASALDKVSSGRWQSKQAIHSHADIEVIRPSEVEKGLQLRGGSAYIHAGPDTRVNGREFVDATLAEHADGSLGIKDGVHTGRKDFSGYERARSPVFLEAKEERNSPIRSSIVQPAGADAKFGGPSAQPLVTSNPPERTNLKFLPRSKPQENLEHPAVDIKKPTEVGRIEAGATTHVNLSSARDQFVDSEITTRVEERPKLKLKPRSQPFEQLEETIEKERKSVFGGARPRELVLKERGIDDFVHDHIADSTTNRFKHEMPRTEGSSGHIITSRLSGRVETRTLDQRAGKNNVKKDHRGEAERPDTQRSWRNETRRNNHEQLQERDHSPETWRKQPKPASPDPSGARYGKVASAVELAQAFSKSNSDPRTADHVSGARGVADQSQVRFSRLVGQPSRRQINGY